jgi:hypothetical protein
MRFRRRTWLALLAVLLSVGAVRLGLYLFRRGLTGPRHEFVLPDPPAFLTESLALGVARETLALDGLDPTEWQPQSDGRATAPDKFLERDERNPNLGWVTFRGPRGQVRFVSVELTHDRIVCQSSLGI